jgi:hypothetical protein
MIMAHMNQLHAIARALLERETLSNDEFEAVFQAA